MSDVDVDVVFPGDRSRRRNVNLASGGIPSNIKSFSRGRRRRFVQSNSEFRERRRNRLISNGGRRNDTHYKHLKSILNRYRNPLFRPTMFEILKLCLNIRLSEKTAKSKIVLRNYRKRTIRTIEDVVDF